MNRLHRLVPMLLVLTVAVVGGLVAVSRLSINRLKVDHVTIDGRRFGDRTISLPLTVPSRQGLYAVSFEVSRERLGDGNLALTVDDCLNSLSVNDRAVEMPEIPYCTLNEALYISLSDFLKPGVNQFRLTVFNEQARGFVDLVWTGSPKRRLFFYVGFGISVLIFLVAFGLLLGGEVPSLASAVVLLFGAVFRSWYLWNTPLSKRGYDTEGHIQYIEYILEHWAIPPMTAGWQMYHPPLYYYLNAIWVRVIEWCGAGSDDLVILYRLFSLLLSIAVLYVGYHYTKLLPKGSSPWVSPRITVLLVLVSFPTLVYPSAQVGNDTLVLLILVSCLLMLQRWWQSPTYGRWFGMSVLIAAGLLVKSTTYILAVTAVVACVTCPRISWKRCGVSLITLVIVVIVGIGWFLKVRIIDQHQEHIVGNVSGLNAQLNVTSTFQSLSTFNPAAIIEIPYIDPWKTETRRDNFLEYEFRSAFMGEFRHGESVKWIARLLLGVGMAALLALIWGVFDRLVRWDVSEFPMLVAIVVTIGAAYGIRVTTPVAPIQDFRYIAFLLPTLAFLSVRTKPGVLNGLSNLVLLGLSGCSLVFFFLMLPE